MGTDTHQRRTLATGDLVFVTRPETSGAFGDRVVTTVWRQTGMEVKSPPDNTP